MLLNTELQLHDIRDTERLCRRVLDNHLRKTKATLNHHDTEDAISYLVETAWELSTRYDPARTSSFSKYAYSVLTMRVVDWYRQRFYRDQTSTDWYRRNNPNAQPATADEQRNFHFPATLDQDTHEPPAAPDHRERDTLGFALRALTADPSTDCDPALFNALSRRPSQETPSLDLRHQRAHAGTAKRDRRAA